MTESEFKTCLFAHKLEHIISNGARGDTFSDGGASGARRREDRSPQGRDVDSVHDSRSRRARNNHRFRREYNGYDRG